MEHQLHKEQLKLQSLKQYQDYNLCLKIEQYKKLERRFGVNIGVVVTDTFGRPWRIGQVNVAIGLSGIPATIKEQGKYDAWGRRLNVTEPAFADELAAASGLMMQKSSKTPVILFQGLHWSSENSVASDLLRTEKEDMFR